MQLQNALTEIETLKQKIKHIIDNQVDPAIVGEFEKLQDRYTKKENQFLMLQTKYFQLVILSWQR
jgi:hypothetical protein